MKSTISEDTKLKIKLAYDGGMQQRDIAKQYNLAQSTISRVVNEEKEYKRFIYTPKNDVAWTSKGEVVGKIDNELYQKIMGDVLSEYETATQLRLKLNIAQTRLVAVWMAWGVLAVAFTILFLSTL